jgi:lipopolysaccharide transport system permease protein
MTGELMEVTTQSDDVSSRVPGETEAVSGFAARNEKQEKPDLPSIRIGPSRGWVSLRLGELWEHRELLYFLVWRDVKVRYKQAVLGATWTVIQPLITMMIFTVIFSYFAKISTAGVPYPLFVFSALLPWNYFASAFARGGNSLLGDAHLIEKVYFPRLILPLCAVTTPLMDFFFSFLVLLGLMLWFGIMPTWNVMALPFFISLALLTALATALWLAPLNVRYRDIGHTIPFLVQVWMYASPVVYPIGMIPERWRLLYSLNPMVGVIEGFRWALFGNKSPAFDLMAASGTMVLLLLWGGAVFFRRMERTFADVV